MQSVTVSGEEPEGDWTRTRRDVGETSERAKEREGERREVEREKERHVEEK